MIFTERLRPLEELKNECCVILDTNALLLPYTISQASLDEIIRVYSLLVKEERLIIPGQVVREFTENRPGKISDLHQKLLRKKSEIGKIK